MGSGGEAVSPPRLSRRLAHGEGDFSPFTYSIGLEAPLRETLAAFKEYPLPQPVSEEAIAELSKSLTFVHEAAHLAQYVTCSFGLRTLRRTLICNRYLYEGGPWQLPVTTSMRERLFEHGDELDDHERRAYLRFFAFLEAADQLRIHTYTSDATSDQRRIELGWEPWSAYYFMLAPDDPKARVELAPRLQEGGVKIHRLPHLTFTDAAGTQAVVLNAAALMETFALLVELNHIYNALGTTIDPFELVPDGKRYLAALEFALESGACSEANMLLTVAVCIDLALMYDPFVLFDAPSVELPPDDRPADQLPGETFINACAAAARIEPIQSFEQAEVARFYRALCDEMDLPSPEWMSERAARRASQILADSGVEVERAWLGKALRIHADALRYRLGRPASLPCDLLASDPMFDVVEICMPEVSYFDLTSHEPEHFHPGSIDLLTVHNLIWQALSQERIDCPLKQGDPFYCESALAAPDKLCVWSGSECLVDLFERDYNLRSMPS
jgi:hypothetical protein